MEVLQENQEKMMKSITFLRHRMKNIEANHAQMLNMLSALLKHHEVDYRKEDVVVEEPAAI